MTFMTIAEVSEKLRRHRVTVSRMVRAGELRAVKGEGKNGRVLVYADSVQEYLDRNTVQPDPDPAAEQPERAG